VKIERPSLIESLEEFALGGSGLIVGKPGIGKSHSLRRLRERLKQNSIPQLFIPVEDLGEGHESDFQHLLKYEGSLVDNLRSAIAPGSEHGVLIIDGFDAMRDAAAQQRLLDVIKELRVALKDTWNVLVAVRTWDATKSQSLIRIFPVSDLKTQNRRDLECRYFEIPDLSESEILASGIPDIQATYRSGGAGFQALLKTPFFLWLLEKLIRGGENAASLSSIASETQLLQRFWSLAIGSKAALKKEHVVRTVVTKMVDQKSLGALKASVYDPSFDSEWQELLSSEIFQENGPNSQRVSFSHNILFDYAVSAVLIDPDVNGLKKFIEADESRPLFLRPSLIYFLTSIWHEDRSLFWNVFWLVLPSDSHKLRLFARLLLPSVVVNESSSLKDFEPLVVARASNRTGSVQAVLHVLQVYQYSGFKNYRLWAELLESLIPHLDRIFLWDYARITTRILDEAKTAKDTATIRRIGFIARGLMKLVWRERKPTDSWLDGLGAHHVLPLVAETFSTEPAESRVLLDKTLELVKEADFPINYLFRLTDNLDTIWGCDPDFVAKVYISIFSHEETSDKKTEFGSPILPLISNRKQDYELCYYHLVQKFPEFLKVAPMEATRAAIRLLNNISLEEQVYSRVQPGDPEIERVTFSFRGRVAQFVADSCHWWDETEYQKEPYKIATDLMSYLSSPETEIDTVNDLLDIFAEEAVASFWWKRLLKNGASNVERFQQPLEELLFVSILRDSFETSFDWNVFLEASGPHIAQATLAKIESSILRELVGNEDDERPDLLALMPADRLSAESRDLLTANQEKLQKRVRRRPGTFESGWRAFDDDESYKGRGIKIDEPENSTLRAAWKLLESFLTETLNNNPTDESAVTALKLAKDLRSVINASKNAHAEIIESAETKLAEAAERISRVVEDVQSEAFQFCKDVLLEAAQNDSPHARPDEDERFTSPGWSPAPRNEAAEGIPWLLRKAQDKDLFSAFDKLLKDPHPSVRYLSASNLFRVAWTSKDYFWSSAERMIKDEHNTVVVHAVLHSVARAFQTDINKAQQLYREAEHRFLKPGNLDELQKSIVSILVDLAVTFDDNWASNRLNDLFKDASRFSHAVHHAVFRLSANYIHPGFLKDEKKKLWMERSIARLVSSTAIIKKSLIELKKKVDFKNLQESEREQFRELYSAIDSIVTRIYFAMSVKEGRRDEKNAKDAFPSKQEMQEFYSKVKPLLNSTLDFAEDQDVSGLFASTAHHFMQFLVLALPFDPSGVLKMAARVATASESSGYNLDSMAIKEVVTLVEITLADHKLVLREQETLNDLMILLDVFAKAGWTDALRLIWKLNEIFR